MLAIPIAIASISGYLGELVLLMLVNPSHFLGKFGKGEGGAEEEVKLLSGRSLTLVGFSAAALTFLLAQLSSHPELDEAVFLVGVAFVFFLTGFNLDTVAATRRFFFEAQTRSLSYGLIVLTLALALGYGRLSALFASIVFLLPVVPIGWHLVELGHDLIYYRSLARQGLPPADKGH
jgi:hypothetical protein